MRGIFGALGLSDQGIVAGLDMTGACCDRREQFQRVQAEGGPKWRKALRFDAKEGSDISGEH